LNIRPSLSSKTWIMQKLLLIFLLPTLLWAEVPLSPSRVMVVVGILKEANLARHENTTILVSGADPQRLRELLENADYTDIKAIVSFGVAGGLHPFLNPGDIIVPSHIVQDDQEWPVDDMLASQFRQTLAMQGLRVYGGTMLGSDTVIATPEHKAQLFESAKAVAVDMESHIAADVAKKRGLPFAAIRVVMDSASHALPPATANAVTPEGEIRIRAVIGALLRRPLQLPKLVHTSLASRKAFQSLSQCGSLLAP
jgi:hopanoid-associated phosphorylase